jgi:hypothetical protein
VRASRGRFVTVLIAVLVAGTGVSVAVAQSGTQDPDYSQIAVDNAAAASTATPPPSAGVPASDCPAQVAAMEAAGMPAPSPDDHIYPDCSAGAALLQAWIASQTDKAQDASR